MTTDPAKQFPGRYSHNMTRDKWEMLATAYDTWNEHLEYCEDGGCQIDADIKDFVKDVFSSHGLWDTERDEPNLGQYRLMIMYRC